MGGGQNKTEINNTIIDRSMSRWKERLRRLKNRGGHGIHPPFAFRMVSMVTEAKESTYALESLLSELSSKVRGSECCGLKLLYRAIRYMEPSDLQILGAPSALEMLFVQQAMKDRMPGTVAISRKLIFIGQGVNKQEWTDVLHMIRQQPDARIVVLVTHLKDAPECVEAWEELVKEFPNYPAYDLMDLGVLSFEKGLHAQYFKLYV